MNTREQELTELVERRTGSGLPSYAETLADDPAPRGRARGAGA